MNFLTRILRSARGGVAARRPLPVTQLEGDHVEGEPPAVAHVPQRDQAQIAPAQPDIAPAQQEQVSASAPAERVSSSRGEPVLESRQAHDGLPRFLMIVLGIAAVGLSVAFMKQLADIITPIFFGLNLMITVYPLYRWLRGHRWPGWLASIIAGLVVFGVLVAFVAGLAWAVAAMVNELPNYSRQFDTLYRQSIDLLAQLGYSEEWLVQRVKGINPQSALAVLGSVLNDARGVLTMLVVIITAMIFMVMDTPDMYRRMNVAERSHPRFIGALEHFCVGVRKYWVVTTIFGLIVAVLDWAVLLGLGVPLALVWGVFSFLTNYIPNIGFVIGLIPPALLALFESGPKIAIAVVVAYCVLNFVVQSIIQPKFAGNAVGLGPTLSFISLLLWTYVLGPLGALLALPSSLLVKALLIDADPRARWANALISSRIEDAEQPVAVEEPDDDSSPSKV